MMIYSKMSNDAYLKTINKTEGRSYVYLDLKFRGSSGDEQVIIELFEDSCPKTCDNFKKLCCGFQRPDGVTIGYKGTTFSRILKGRFI